MKLSPSILRRALQKAGYLTLACGLLLAAGLHAQSSSSSYNDNPGYQGNPDYPQGNPNYQYNSQRPPRYTGHSWTDHLVLEGGGGVTIPAGDTQNFANTGYNVLLGGGYRFNDRLSLLAEWNFNRLGVPHSLAGVVAGTPDGNEHIWTVDLNPKFNFIQHGRMDGYVIGGGGFSRALTNFTVPVLFYCYDYFGYPYPCSGNVTVASTSTNQANMDIGAGAEFGFSRYDRGKLFIEARYQKLFSPKTGLPPGYNANLIPVTLGLRW